MGAGLHCPSAHSICYQGSAVLSKKDLLLSMLGCCLPAGFDADLAELNQYIASWAAFHLQTAVLACPLMHPCVHCAGQNSPGWVKGTGKIGIISLTPSSLTFQALLNETYHGYDSHAGRWRLDQAEQDLVRFFLNFPTLPGPLQMFPDVCYNYDEPLQYFPLRRMSFVHFTWTYGTNIYVWPYKHGDDCWNQFGKLYQHFNRQVLITANFGQLVEQH